MGTCYKMVFKCHFIEERELETVSPSLHRAKSIGDSGIKTIKRVCVCVCVCLRACVCACICVYARLCLNVFHLLTFIKFTTLFCPSYFPTAPTGIQTAIKPAQFGRELKYTHVCTHPNARTHSHTHTRAVKVTTHRQLEHDMDRSL